MRRPVSSRFALYVILGLIFIVAVTAFATATQRIPRVLAAAILSAGTSRQAQDDAQKQESQQQQARERAEELEAQAAQARKQALEDARKEVQEADTTGFEATIGSKDGKAVKIRIDESGISIKGPVDEDLKPEVVRDYREKGTDIIKFGEDVHIEKDELIRGDVVVFGADIQVDGVVGGNVVVIGGDIDVSEGAEIKGDAVVVGGELIEATGSVIKGERVEVNTFMPFNVFQFANFQPRVFQIFWMPVKLILSLILSLLILLFLRDRVMRSESHITDNVLKCFGVGFLVIFIGGFTVTILAILLGITIIGIPLAFLLVVSSAGVLIFAWTIAAYALGEAVRRKMQWQASNAFLAVFIGTVVLFLPGFFGQLFTVVPFFYPVGIIFKLLGFFLQVFAELAGLGALFLSHFGGRAVVKAPVDSTPAPATT